MKTRKLESETLRRKLRSNCRKTNSKQSKWIKKNSVNSVNPATYSVTNSENNPCKFNASLNALGTGSKKKKNVRFPSGKMIQGHEVFSARLRYAATKIDFAWWPPFFSPFENRNETGIEVGIESLPQEIQMSANWKIRSKTNSNRFIRLRIEEFSHLHSWFHRLRI